MTDYEVAQRCPEVVADHRPEYMVRQELMGYLRDIDEEVLDSDYEEQSIDELLEEMNDTVGWRQRQDDHRIWNHIERIDKYEDESADTITIGTSCGITSTYSFSLFKKQRDYRYNYSEGRIWSNHGLATGKQCAGYLTDPATKLLKNFDVRIEHMGYKYLETKLRGTRCDVLYIRRTISSMRSYQRPFVGGLWDIKSLTIDEIYNIDAVAAWKTQWNDDARNKLNILSRSVVEIQIEPCHNVDLERVVKLNTLYKDSGNRKAETITTDMFIHHNMKQLEKYYNSI